MRQRRQPIGFEALISGEASRCFGTGSRGQHSPASFCPQASIFALPKAVRQGAASFGILHFSEPGILALWLQEAGREQLPAGGGLPVPRTGVRGKAAACFQAPTELLLHRPSSRGKKSRGLGGLDTSESAQGLLYFPCLFIFLVGGIYVSPSLIIFRLSFKSELRENPHLHNRRRLWGIGFLWETKG
ncbi:hypothetical protein NDU88_006367 [Pleurodeles waltl]|uniref:Uncharacterized protein n=1 Tax=Pleurodeles waltl TaxID=8319 RepID=A0AAV7UPF3_PLEWA|nr:hypothetical protein NDU88_006367 [Pleurodeles waltl]